ncbi:MAG: zinc-binding alcohol dehydrogenase family protein [Caldilineaceae bacterium SB0668_bin_21]|nr:zinc-binding alcohol dehydrogenase family protein [Caldilineaceae bacterium SB0668_bin_21]MYC20298.1 zinc-binding alcohol dehydrogenase family protein [Caldilineaceae bacterium SB0662_bin_25]
MKTVILEKPGSLHLTETAPPVEPGAGEALVRVHRVGICGTDLHAFRGRQPYFSYPRILGHELGVEIVALDPDGESNLRAGDRCAVEPYLNCGGCSACRRGRMNCCSHLRVLGVHMDGGMRELITVPIDKLHRSETLPLEHLALVETLCIGAHAVDRAGLEPGESTLVIGAGPIGLTAVAFARLAGADAAVMEIDENRMRFVQENLGVEHLIDGRGDAEAQLRAVFGGDLPLTVFDATGNARSMMNALGLIEQGGSVVFISLVQDDITFPDPEFHRRETTLISSRNATSADFARVVETLETGAIDLAPWLTHSAPPEELIDAFPGWSQPENQVVKAMLHF